MVWGFFLDALKFVYTYVISDWTWFLLYCASKLIFLLKLHGQNNWSKIFVTSETNYKSIVTSCHWHKIYQTPLSSFQAISFPLSHASFCTVCVCVPGTSRWMGQGWNLISVLLRKPHLKFLNQATSSIHRQHGTVLQLLPDVRTHTAGQSCPLWM